MPLIGAT